MQIIFWALILFFTLLGLSYFLSFINYNLLKLDSKKIIVINVDETTDDLEFLIKSALYQTRMVLKDLSCEIFIVDNKMSDENKKICEIFIRKNNYISILNKNEFYQIISDINLQKNNNYTILNYGIKK